jgi:antitoxin VapB
MPLYIKDPKVAEMADRLKRLTDAASKTEAVSKALESALDALETIDKSDRELLIPRIKEAVAIARQIGQRNEDFDQKDFSDEMWGP